MSAQPAEKSHSLIVPLPTTLKQLLNYQPWHQEVKIHSWKKQKKPPDPREVGTKETAASAASAARAESLGCSLPPHKAPESNQHKTNKSFCPRLASQCSHSQCSLNQQEDITVSHQDLVHSRNSSQAFPGRYNSEASATPPDESLEVSIPPRHLSLKLSFFWKKK